jgi:hypothetical protein
MARTRNKAVSTGLQVQTYEIFDGAARQQPK